MKPQARCAFRPAAFSLIELLVVIAIIGMLSPLVLPAVAKVCESGRSYSDQLSRSDILRYGASGGNSGRAVGYRPNCAPDPGGARP